MTYRPKNNTNKEKILTAVTAITAILVFAAAGFVNAFPGLYQISGLVLAVVSVELYMKYVGSDYIYDADDTSFKVYKVTGKKSICVCSLNYEMSLTGVVSSDDYLANKRKYPKTNFNLNYAKNLAPEEYSVYFFIFNGKKSMVKFEPSKEFATHLNEKINEALAKKSDDEEE